MDGGAKVCEMSDFAALARIVGIGQYFRTGSLEDPEKLQEWGGEALGLCEAGGILRWR
jgi:hypothetical protein